jgi:hypothetical protein
MEEKNILDVEEPLRISKRPPFTKKLPLSKEEAGELYDILRNELQAFPTNPARQQHVKTMISKLLKERKGG